ncbi:trypsin-like [Ceratina calcarata]|uniref:Trypsin-like n=1 Tax=Ceratina calcarata TaxID=156304 RepID=A0AAJ7JAS8_9HYME|nr:trypsin-like [Ceratina calcarata]
MAQLALPLILILGIAFAQAFPEDPTRIVGGTNARLGQYPYQVSLRNQGSHFCGGTLVGRRHVVTAAHCIQGVVSAPWNGFTVVTGTVSLKNGGQSHRVASATVHPNYSSNNAQAYPNDIAVVTVSKAFFKRNRLVIPGCGSLLEVKTRISGITQRLIIKDQRCVERLNFITNVVNITRPKLRLPQDERVGLFKGLGEMTFGYEEVVGKVWKMTRFRMSNSDFGDWLLI